MTQALTTIYQVHNFDNLLDNLTKLAKLYGNSAAINNLHKQVTEEKLKKSEQN